MRDYEKMRKVTFSEGLPRGTCGTFTHGGELWQAFPMKKMTEIGAVQTRALGALDRVHDDLVALINAHPEYAAGLAPMLTRTGRAKKLVEDKNQAWTMRGVNSGNPAGAAKEHQGDVESEEAADGA